MGIVAPIFMEMINISTFYITILLHIVKNSPKSAIIVNGQNKAKSIRTGDLHKWLN